MLNIRLTALVILSFSFLALTMSPHYSSAATLSTATTQSSSQESGVKFLEQASFVDAAGRTNVMGTIRNTANVPLQVDIGVNVTQSDGRSVTLTNTTYGRVVWPLTDSPFKLTLAQGQTIKSSAFVTAAMETDLPYYSFLSLNYTNMAVGASRSLVGTIKNNGPFDAYGISIFASIHDGNMTQLDTVRSNVIPVLRAGEQETFAASPDPSIRSKAFYYSCAGVDLNDPITVLNLGGGKFLAFDFQSVAKVSGFEYDNNTRSIAFNITHYNPNGGPMSMKIPQYSHDQNVQILLDGQPDSAGSVNADGRTISIGLFIPKGEHHVEIQNVTTVPEYPMATLALAGAIGAALVIARTRIWPRLNIG